MRMVWVVLVCGAVGLGCSPSSRSNDQGGDGDGGETNGTGDDGGGDGGPGDGDGDGSGDDDSGGHKFDIDDDGDGGGGSCSVPPGADDAIGDCTQKAPPNSFDADVQWTWGTEDSLVTPLVANLTDDDGNGIIDLCDTPDVLVVVGGASSSAKLVVLDGASGTELLRFSGSVSGLQTPAIGDIDGDGDPEVVSLTGGYAVIAFEHDGTLKWQTPQMTDPNSVDIALGDLDADGDVEIVADASVYDHDGNLVWEIPLESTVDARSGATVLSDINGDGYLDLVVGHAAYDHNGAELYFKPRLLPGFPHVADFDEDGEPEILLTNKDGVSLLEANGDEIFDEELPTSDPAEGNNWFRPAAVLDQDGDGRPEFAMNSERHYSVFAVDPATERPTVVWSVDVLDDTGSAAGTAFDFLGDAGADAMFADEYTFYVFDENGNVLMSVPRRSITINEYPVVADVDNDGSAEIVVVSEPSRVGPGEPSVPTVQVIRDRQDRWIQARRIWNQFTYHVTNVREDGTIPQHERPHWNDLNNFRVQSQIENGQSCTPRPEG